MPTTCGFPNCKFRSRYRGADDNRHFYRVPKKPAILRMKWLEAIGRTEETIVSQLRVCSGHFFGGEKKEGDVPVSDPAVDVAIKVELPPKTFRTSSSLKRNKRRAKAMSHSIIPPLKQFSSNPNILTAASNITNFITPPLLLNPHFTHLFQELTGNSMTNYINSFGSMLKSFPPLFRQPFSALLSSNSTPLTNDTSPRIMKPSIISKPTVALIGLEPASMDDLILGTICNLKYVDSTFSSMPEDEESFTKILTIVTNTFLTPTQIAKFPLLRHLIKIGPDLISVDVQEMTDKNIAVSVICASCVDEHADSTLSLILNLYRQTSFLTSSMSETNQIFEWSKTASEHTQVKAIKGQILGLIGLGQIGVAVAIRARVFGFQVRFYDPTISSGSDWYLGLKRVDSFSQLLSESDCVSVQIDPLSDFTNLLSSNWWGHLKKGAYFVNISSVPAMKIANNFFENFEKSINGAAISLSNVEYDLIDDLIELKSNKIMIMPSKYEYSQSCMLEMREAAFYEAGRGLFNSSLDNLRCCINKDDIQLKNNHFLKFQKNKSCTTSPNGDTSKMFSVESFILNNKPSETLMTEDILLSSIQ